MSRLFAIALRENVLKIRAGINEFSSWRRLPAYWRKKPKLGLMHHSDRGSQYCSAAYRALTDSYGMKTSMSRFGNCWDNAPMESFFGTLKTESLHHYRFATREQARQVVFEYIEVFYNRIRRHAKIGNQVPADFANRFYASRQHSAA